MESQAFDQAATVARSKLYQRIRAYFSATDALEVEVPLLGRGGSLEPHLESMLVSGAGEILYLQTSPEFFMKRLLCQGAGDIYTITRAFRSGEQGRLHNPEFSLLEWYRRDFSIEDLIDDLLALLRSLSADQPVSRFSYQQVFEKATGQNPHSPDPEELKALAAQLGLVGVLDTSELLDFVVSTLIEPELPAGLVVITEFPACQAELARIVPDAEGSQVAERFEIYWNGVELANGYRELTDANEQRYRFQAAQVARRRKGLPEVVIDEQFLSALEHGMPECSGVALGLDRLLACLGGHHEIARTLCFPWSRL